jgi:hypothetical protein
MKKPDALFASGFTKFSNLAIASDDEAIDV